MKTPAPRRETTRESGLKNIQVRGLRSHMPHDVSKTRYRDMSAAFSILHKAKNNTDGLDPPGMPVPYLVVGSQAKVWRNSETYL